MTETDGVSPRVRAAVARATGSEPANCTIHVRPAMPHQANRLHDVWADGRHFIAKEYPSLEELDGPVNEFRALVLVQSLDIAPRPVFFDASIGPVVVYAFLEGTMWDRRVPSPADLVALAEVWIRLHALPGEGLWIARGQGRARSSLIDRLRSRLEAFTDWAERQSARQRSAARITEAVLERALAVGMPLIPKRVPLCFCRSDTRFCQRYCPT